MSVVLTSSHYRAWSRFNFQLSFAHPHPAFLPGGEAAPQWEAATGALVRRSRLRRCSWQRLVAQFATDPDLAWLVNGLAAKYGIEPSEA